MKYLKVNSPLNSWNDEQHVNVVAKLITIENITHLCDNSNKSYVRVKYFKNVEDLKNDINPIGLPSGNMRVVLYMGSENLTSDNAYEIMSKVLKSDVITE